MKISPKKIAKRTLKLCTWSLAVLMCLVVFVQVAFWAAIVWINTSSGQSFLQSALGTQLKDSGYTVKLGGFSYIFPTLMGVGSLTVYEGDNPLVSVNHVRLDLDVFPLDEKVLSVDLNIGEVIIEQSKKQATANQTAEKTSPVPIVLESSALPDIYFRRIVIDDLSIGKLVVKGADDLVLSPSLAGDVTLSNGRLVTVSLHYTDDAQTRVAYMPRYIDIKGVYNTVLSDLNIENIKVQAPEYTVSSHAQATFRQGQEFKATLTAKTSLVENLSPLKVTVTAKNAADFFVKVAGKGSYFEKAISLNADIASRSQVFDIKNLNIRAPDVGVTGNVSFDTSKSIATGKVTAKLDSLVAYQSFVGAGHELSPTTADIALIQSASGQAFKIGVKSAGYKNRDANLSLKNIVMDALFSGQVFTLNSLTLQDKDKNDLKAKGTFNIATQTADFSLRADKYRALKGDIANGVINADIRFFGDPSKYTLSGNINPERIEIKIPERMGGTIPQLNVETKADAKKKQAPDITEAIDLDLIVDAPRQIFVRGWGLDAEFGGKLEVKGTAKTPRVFGDFSVIRGRFAEFGKKFSIAKAKMLFSGTIPPSPKMDILTETKAGDIIAKIAITGNVMKPEMKFLSEPALPQDEVMSHILFGQDMEKITPFQAVQLAQTMQRYSGLGGSGGGFDPMGMLRSVTGLDDIRVETDEEGQATVGAGKYLTDKVYLEFEAGSEEDSGNANVQVELTPNITLESEVGQDARAGAGVFWKWDY
ncbi:MAG: translocation/assembly module TamB domain-containing protein [Alcanivorax sp.]